jgi:hypothetical protein
MKLRHILLLTGAIALMSAPAWATPRHGHSNKGSTHRPSSTPVGPPTSTPNNENNPGAANRTAGKDNGQGANGQGAGNGQGQNNPNDQGKGKGQGNGKGKGHSHKCTPHKVAYVASGKLVSQTLTKNADGTYTGEVVVEVGHTNHHGSTDKGKTVTYKLANAHVTFALADTNKDGSVGPDDLVAGDRVHVLGKITTLAKKCSQTEFVAETTIRKAVFHAPVTTTTTSTSTTMSS